MRVRLCSIVIPVALIGLWSPCANGQKQSFDPEDDTSCTKILGPQDTGSPSGIRGWIYWCSEEDLKRERREFVALKERESIAPEPEKESFKALFTTFGEYRSLMLAKVSKECGNSCGAEMSQDEASVNYAFLVMAEGFREAGFPSYSAAEIASAEAKLNAAYKASMAGRPKSCPAKENAEYDENCVSQHDMRIVERAWLRYREAFVEFGAIKWPEVPADTLRTWLTLQEARFFRG